MRKKPDWIQRIPRIRLDLKSLKTPLLGIKDIAQLFGVSPGHARRLVGRMGPMLHGNALVVDVDDVLKLLSDTDRTQMLHTGCDAAMQEGKRCV